MQSTVDQDRDDEGKENACQPDGQARMGKDDHDYCKQGKNLKSYMPDRGTLEIEAIGDEKHGPQNAGQRTQP